MLKNEKGLPYFYKITNRLNGKYYYGSGSTNNYYGSGFALKRAYRKYGKDQFIYEILRYFPTREDAFRFEHLFLTIYKLDKDPKSYNTCRNANGGYISDDVYFEIGKKMKQYRQTKEGSIKGLKNPRADQTIYEFYNIDTGEHKSFTVYDMNQYVMSNLGASMFGYVVRGDRKMYKGWILAENIERFGTREKLRADHWKNWKKAKAAKNAEKMRKYIDRNEAKTHINI